MSLKENLDQLEKLVTNKSNANLEIIKSHTLEILLSLCNESNFNTEMEERSNMIRAFITSLDDLSLRHKILLLLVNLSSHSVLANTIVSLGCIKELYKVIFETMKHINIEHLDVAKSLLEQDNDSSAIALKDDDNKVQEKKYKISDKKTNSNEKDKMMQLDYIKLSIIVFMNSSLFSNKARTEILGIKLENLIEEKKR